MIGMFIFLLSVVACFGVAAVVATALHEWSINKRDNEK